MFCVMWLVTASSITEPIAESTSHCTCAEVDGFAVFAALIFSCEAPLTDIHAVHVQRNAKPTNRNDQPQASCVRSNAGSKRGGKPSSESSEAKSDSASRRYGTASWKRRQYHICSSGGVVERRKYGRPMV